MGSAGFAYAAAKASRENRVDSERQMVDLALNHGRRNGLGNDDHNREDVLKTHTRILFAAGSMLALAQMGAHAQEAAATGVASDAAATQAAVATPDSGEIIVTATRENTLLSKTPVAITAIGGDSLTKTGVTNATQLTEVAPNLSIDRGGSAGLQITIRGVSSTDNSEKGDPSAGFVVDGVFLARPQAQEVSFFDLDRVEVLRGPQGTLYGRNTTAGLVSLISAAPRLGKFSASFDGTYGNYNTIQATGVVNVPVGEFIAVRGAVNYDRRNSYILQGVSPYTLDPAKENLSGPPVRPDRAEQQRAPRAARGLQQHEGPSGRRRVALQSLPGAVHRAGRRPVGQRSRGPHRPQRRPGEHADLSRTLAIAA
jgi:outer membrane receptor protein involved in Fe transport